MQIRRFNFNNCSSDLVHQTFNLIKQVFNRRKGSINFIKSARMHLKARTVYSCGYLCNQIRFQSFKYVRDATVLRVRAFFHKTFRVCHVYCNFIIGFTCRIAIIFGTLKDESLLINTLASNICFSCRNMFQNGVDALSKIVDAFLPKSSKFFLVRIIR